MKKVSFTQTKHYHLFVMLLPVILFDFAYKVNAQEKKATFGIKAGLNISTMSAHAGQTKVNNIDPTAGFHTGLTLDFLVAPQVYIFTGAEYSIKGFVINESQDTDVTASYFQIPLTVGTKLKMENWGIVLNTGPYFAYGLGGKANKGSREWDTFSEKLLRNFDFGFLLGLGIERGKWNFGLNNEVGIINALRKNAEDITMNNFNVALSAGYKF